MKGACDRFRFVADLLHLEQGIWKPKLAAKRDLDDGQRLVGLCDTSLCSYHFQYAFGYRICISNSGYLKRQLLKRPEMIILNMASVDRILIIDIHDKYAARFAEVADICYLYRAGVERPVVDLVMLVSMPETDIFHRGFKFIQRSDRERRDRMHLMAFYIGVKHQDVKRTTAAVCFYRFGQHRDRPIARSSVPV